MTTRHSTRQAARTMESASPPAATANGTTTRQPRSTRSASGTITTATAKATAATAATRDDGDELPVAKRRRISVDSSARSRKRANGAKARDREEASDGDEEDDEEETPRTRRGRGKQNPSGGSADSASDAKPRGKQNGKAKAVAPAVKARGRAKVAAAAPTRAKVTTHQKIQNLYGGRRKHVDRDDTPGSSSVRDASPGNGSVKAPIRKKAAHAAVVDEELDAGVDKFRRGRHGSGKKKAAAAKPPVVLPPPTIVVDAADEENPQGRVRELKRKGRKVAAEDTDKEGDVIMGDGDNEPAAAAGGTRRGRKAAGAASSKLAVEAPKPGRGGRKKANGASSGAAAAAKKDVDESSIYDFPGSDEEDVFTPRARKIVKAPSKLTASLRRAAIAKQEAEISSSSRGHEAGDEKEEEPEAEAEVEVDDKDAEEDESENDVEVEVQDILKATTTAKSEPSQLAKFTGNVTEDAVDLLKQMVTKKITGRGLPDKLVGLTDEYNAVHQLLEQTVVAGEGNSILLVGPHGSGKSLVVEKAVADLQKHHEKDFIVVRLSGSLQTDERTAVKEIWRQLGSSMELDESKPINFADTLTTILALLSHPSEHDPAASAESMTETTSISVLFLLSEFEQFAAHPRQTLLYNLFDIAQARKAPIAVVGMTSKVNIVEDLEKRVKSRFSHRTLGFRIAGGLGSRLEGWWELAKAGLCMDLDDLPADFDFGSDELAYFNHWNASLDDAFQHDKGFRRTVESVYSTTKSVQMLFNHFMIPICDLSVEQPFLGSGDAMRKTALVAPDNKLYLLEDLPELSLALLICAARLDPLLETDTCNFTMAYDEYKTLVAKFKVYQQTTLVVKLWGKDVALAAWEKLAEYELIVPVVGTAAGGGAVGVTASALVGSGSTGVGRRESRMFRVDVGLLEIKRQARAWGLNSTLLGWCQIG
ncbi:hypothetical protein TWF696_009084 [Orbilia brochopaga]|uniref:Origin recognition complex subunit 4 n=1 Tax=Orbilia brochopaga TaxID=3140254 RepID=A0AAV9UES9_9PEZI